MAPQSPWAVAREAYNGSRRPTRHAARGGTAMRDGEAKNEATERSFVLATVVHGRV
jgi:hypothetical protein